MILCLCISVGLAFVLMLDNLLSLVKGFFFFFFEKEADLFLLT